MFTIQDMLSGDIVKRQQPTQQNDGLGALMQFMAQHSQAPQLPEFAPGHTVDPSLLMHMMDRTDKKEALGKKQMEADKIAQQAGAMEPLITQESNPTRLAFLKHVQGQLASGVPELQQSGLANLNDIQGSSLKDVEKPNLVKEVEYTGRTPATKGFQDFLSQVLVKPATNINMGEGQYMRPATAAEKAPWGIPDATPATFNGKTGEVVPKPITLTEDQGKAVAYHKGLEGSIDSLDKLMSTRDTNPTSSTNNVKNYVGDVLSRSGIPGVSTAGVMLESSDQQLFNQAKEEAKVNLIHTLTGGGYTAQEAEDKASAYLPNWGEDKTVWAAKRKSLLGLKDSLVQRAGAGLRQTSATDPLTTKDVMSSPEGQASQSSAREQAIAEARRRGLIK